MSGCGWEVGRAGCTYSLSLSLCVTARHPLWMPCRWNRGCDTRSATVSDAEDSAKASSSAAWCWKMLVSVSEGTGAAPCAVASCGAAPGRVSSDDVRTDVGVTGGPMFAGVTSDVTSNESVPCRAAPCKSQGTAAEVESEVMGDGDSGVPGGLCGWRNVGEGLADDVRGCWRRWQLCTLTITFFGGVRGWHRNGGGGGVEELGQRLLEDSDAGIERGKGIVCNRA